MNYPQVLEKVRGCLAERLAQSEEEVQPQSRLFDDLGSDSLDLLDIIFTLEKRFGIRLRNSDLDRLLRADFAPGEGPAALSATDLERLAQWLPALRQVPDPTTLTPAQLFSYVTVESLALLVAQKLEEA